MAFTPPNTGDTLRAIGNKKDLPIALQRALNPSNDFEIMSIPDRGNWLAEHFEPGQGFENETGWVSKRLKWILNLNGNRDRLPDTIVKGLKCPNPSELSEVFEIDDIFIFWMAI